MAQCEAAFQAGDAAAQATRDQADAAANTAHDAAIASAEAQHRSKHGILNAIEEECNKPPTVTGVSAGAITTGGSGTQIQSGSPACTARRARFARSLSGR